jgi:hypothetical protein
VRLNVAHQLKEPVYVALKQADKKMRAGVNVMILRIFSPKKMNAVLTQNRRSSFFICQKFPILLPKIGKHRIK